MQISPIFLATIIFLGSVIWIRYQPQTTSQVAPQQDVTQSIAHIDTPTSTPTQAPSTPTPTTLPQVSSQTAPTQSPTPTTSDQPIGSSATLIYPGSQLISSNNGSDTYSTSDDANQVGEWYKQQADNYNVTNYVNVTTNGQTTIKFNAQDSQTLEKIELEITQEPGQSTQIIIQKT